MWMNERIEEVKEFKYLGYNFKANNGAGWPLSELARKADKVMEMVWGF